MLWLFLSNSFVSKAQFYNGSNQEFGKNRVQFNTFFWQYHDYERFRVFFYAGGKDNAIYTARYSHLVLQELEAFLETEIDGKLDIVVYNKYADFKQSNVGLTNEVSSNIGGKNRIIGNKVFVYFEESHDNFQKNIRESLAEVIVRKILFGASWRGIVSAEGDLKMPAWYLQGLYSFIGKGEDGFIDELVAENISQKKYKNINHVEGEMAILFGHTIWNYIESTYGRGAISNIIYMTKITRSPESSIQYILGISLDNLLLNWREKYLKLAKDNSDVKESLLKLKSKITYKNFCISDNGNYIAYTSHDMGKTTLWIYDIQKEKKTKVEKEGFRSYRMDDKNNFCLAWSPKGNILAYAVEEKGETNLALYNIDNKEITKRKLIGLQKVLSMQFAKNGQQMVFSAMRESNVDLFLYNLVGNNYKQLTKDIFDDLDPKFFENDTKIIFSSNRISDTLQEEVEVKPYYTHKDLFIYDLEDRRGDEQIMKRVTNTVDVDEVQPMPLSNKEFAYLSNNAKKNQRYLAVFDSTISSVDSTVHYRYYSKSFKVKSPDGNIFDLGFNANKEYVMVTYLDGKYVVHTDKVENDMVLDEVRNSSGNAFDEKPSFGLDYSTSKPVDGKIIIKNNPRYEYSRPSNVDTYNYSFGVKSDVLSADTIAGKNTSKMLFNQEFELPRQQLYRTNFTSDYVVTQIDNSFLNPSYQRFMPGSPVFNNSGINSLFLLGAKDLFEDYRIIGGVRYGFDLNSNDYMIGFEDLSQRLDKKYLFIRQVYSGTNIAQPQKIRTYEFKYNLKYPFSEVSSISGTIGYRNDNIINQGYDRPSLESENVMEHNSSMRLAYVYDNTISRGLNLLQGTRLKIFGEYYQQFFKNQGEILAQNTDFFVVGVDVRHYQKIHRDLIFASRFAASTSFGSRKLVYYMGGVDNWISPKFNTSQYVPLDKGYAFQTIATPVRGFLQNGRNGNSFFVVNNEIRFPIVKYFSNKPISSDFFENFQINLFHDIGTAWNGLTPYSPENSFNKETFYQKPVTIEVEYQKEPIIMGYGFGLRSRLFGYFIRFDVAWGLDDGVVGKNIKYLSLTLDF